MKRGGNAKKSRVGRNGRSRLFFILSRRMNRSSSGFQFKRSHVSRNELIVTLREILAQLEGAEGSEADSTAA